MLDCTQILTDINKVDRSLISHKCDVDVEQSWGSPRACGHAQQQTETAHKQRCVY